MKIFLNYIKNFDCLAITLKNALVNKLVRKDDVVCLFNDEELVGFNVYKLNLNINENNLENDLLKKHLIEILNKNGIFDKIEDQFIVAKVLKVDKIPNTHLSKCEVFDGKNNIQIICGAKNVKEGLLTVLATEGSWLPNGLQINKGKINGFESFGMLCSKKELNIISDKINNNGIIELNIDEKEVGNSIWKLII
ncbi:putative tRNA-binding protein [Spiroplasma litorale]|uniref:Putative tRNA-binding protein n=1 Tax=Spiroplasma litorale TaxID=216942 RepID=A0A0K1W0V7_9MOLU|nr:hypothetical protein [Spiroplasma litorale]AKX33811.1 putative tRNA-binding protein [Spiroplasma litorale]